MEVQVREKCFSCRRGYVYSPEWEQYNKEWEEWSKTHPNRAYGSQKEFDSTHPQPFGPEEYPCDQCKGTTWLYRWIDSTLLIREI